MGSAAGPEPFAPGRRSEVPKGDAAMRRLTVGCVLVLGLLAGCQSHGRDLAGHWKGQIPTPDPFLSNSSLDLRPDGTYTERLGAVSFNGKWKVEGSRIILAMDILRADDALDIAANGRELLPRNEEGKKAGFRWVKE